MSGGDNDDYMNGGAGDDILCGGTETFAGDELDDGDANPGPDLLWSAGPLDLGVWCGNTTTRYDCSLIPLSGIGTCSASCLAARPGCP